MKVEFKEDITPSLVAMDRVLANPKPSLDEVGQLMVTLTKEAHTGQRGLQDGRPYAKLSKAYSIAKGKAGGNVSRILFGPSPRSDGAGGDLFASWGVIYQTKIMVMVGAKGGSKLNRIKASAHDGGLAQYLGRESLNRLRLGWNEKDFGKAMGIMMDRVMKAGNDAPKGA